MMISGWDHPLANLRSELVQLEEEGYVVPESVKRDVAMLHPEADKWSERIADIYKKLDDLPVRAGWAYEEPDELDEIRRLRPEGPRRMGSHPEHRRSYSGISGSGNAAGRS